MVCPLQGQQFNHGIESPQLFGIQFDFPATHSLCCRGNETLHDNKLKIRENSTLDSLDLCLSFDLRATEIKFQAFSHGVFRHQRAPNCTIQCHRINRERFVHTNTEKYLTQFFFALVT